MSKCVTLTFHTNQGTKGIELQLKNALRTIDVHNYRILVNQSPLKISWRRNSKGRLERIDMSNLYRLDSSYKVPKSFQVLNYKSKNI